MKFLKKLFSKPKIQTWKKAPQDWREAKKLCTGYESVKVSECRAKPALLPYPVIANLMKIAEEKNGKISVLDFGGGTGGTYYACEPFLKGVEVVWDIIEQESVVKQVTWEIPRPITFYSAFRFNVPIQQKKYFDVALLSGVLQYLEDYKVILEQLVDAAPEYIILDRTIIYANSKDKFDLLTIQHNLDNSSYPCWILNQNILEKWLKIFYEKQDEFFSAADRVDKIAGVRIKVFGAVWKRK